jgi:transposase InsO family protein
MPFITKSTMSQRLEFCVLAAKPESNISDLCRRFNITRRTGYKWLGRYLEENVVGLIDKSRQPLHSPNKTPAVIEDYVIQKRISDPAWGSLKLHKLICNDKEKGLYTYGTVPCRSAINKILKRNGLIDPNLSKVSKAFERFEYDYPNELWQMDYKGYFKLLNRKLCHPLTITDDHSRFNICLKACQDQQKETVQKELINVFRKYGMPYMILADNGSPWGASGEINTDGTRCFTTLEKWFIQLNIKLIHGRPFHPQTQGKEERFHKTLKKELLDREQFRDYDHCQKRFDCWREKYNCIRPHESLDLRTPADIYAPSTKSYPEKLEIYEYNLSDIKRRVQTNGIISFKNKHINVGKAFIGDYVAIRESQKNNTYEIYFCNQLLRTISL